MWPADTFLSVTVSLVLPVVSPVQPVQQIALPVQISCSTINVTILVQMDILQVRPTQLLVVNSAVALVKLVRIVITFV